MATRCLVRHAIAGAALLCVLAQVARAQDRMPPIPKDQWSAELQKAASTRTGAAATGPWVPLSRSPEVMGLMMDMRSHVASRSLLGPALTEMAILIAAREWTQQYEWNAHEPAAAKAGLKPEIINAIKDGRRPKQMSEQEESLYDLCIELHRTKSVSDPTYDRALKALGGEDKVVEVVSLEGYYALLAMVMNTARTPLPAGRTPPLALFPR
jgi:4-carboxymuconolactone decarboxylase